MGLVGKSARDRAVAAARHARKGSYSPYSGVKIGAAVIVPGGKVYTGCNVENASYGLSLCAERVAILKAVSEGARRVLALAVAGDSAEYTLPCGACLQVMAEFGPDSPVYRRGEDGFSEDTDLRSLLPAPFYPGGLRRR